MSTGAAATAFATKYGLLSISKFALVSKITAFISAVAPYLLVAIAIIVAAYLTYKAVQTAIIKKIKKKIPRKLLTKDGRVNLKVFNIKLPNGGGWKGPGGWKIVKDFAKHGGSIWKLLDQAGKRIASLRADGTIRGK